MRNQRRPAAWATLTLACALTLALYTLPARADVDVAEFQKASALVVKASDGDKDAIPDAVAAFDRLSKADPGNPVVLVNLGAATSMMARTTFNPFRKISLVEDGLGLQDKALALLGPANSKVVFDGVEIALRVKFVAASTFLALPGFFHRTAQGAALLSEVQGVPGFSGAPIPFKGAVWLRAAQLAAERKEPEAARRLCRQVIDVHAPQSEAAKALLASL